MSPTLTIVLLWVAFAITHLAFSSLKLRPRLVGVLGEFGFMGAYSLIALVTFVPMVGSTSAISIRAPCSGPSP